jgi:hypothetical protein
MGSKAAAKTAGVATAEELGKLSSKIEDINSKIAAAAVKDTSGFGTKAAWTAGGIFGIDAIFLNGKIFESITAKTSQSAGNVAKAAGNVVGTGVGGVFSGIFGDYWYLFLGGILIFFMYFFIQILTPHSVSPSYGMYRGGGSGSRIRGLGLPSYSLEIVISAMLLIMFAWQIIVLQSMMVESQATTSRD